VPARTWLVSCLVEGAKFRAHPVKVRQSCRLGCRRLRTSRRTICSCVKLLTLPPPLHCGSMFWSSKPSVLPDTSHPADRLAASVAVAIAFRGADFGRWAGVIAAADRKDEAAEQKRHQQTLLYYSMLPVCARDTAVRMAFRGGANFVSVQLLAEHILVCKLVATVATRLHLAADLVILCAIPLRGTSTVARRARRAVSPVPLPLVLPPSFRRPAVRAPRCASRAAGGRPAPLSAQAGWPWKPVQPAIRSAQAGLDQLTPSPLRRPPAAQTRTTPRVRHHAMRHRITASRLLPQKQRQRPQQMLHLARGSSWMQRPQDVPAAGTARDPVVSCHRRSRQP